MKKRYIVTVAATAGFEVWAEDSDEAGDTVEEMDTETVLDAFRHNGFDVTEVSEIPEDE